MGCELYAGEFTFHTEFNCRKHKQKILIDALLRYSKLNSNNLATILEVPGLELQDVRRGKSFLNTDAVFTLAKLFLTFFGE